MSKKGTKTIETKLGSINHPKNGFEQLVELKTTHTKPKPAVEIVKASSKIELSKKPVAPVPEVKLSPLRSRFQERSAGKVPIQEQPHPLTQKRDESKPRKKVVVDVKSPPKVFKSPTWYKSPSRKVVSEENVCLKQLLMKDPRYTEQDIEKILQDHK
jgi:hypothetical protein